MKPDEIEFLKACQAQCPPYKPGRDLKSTRFPRDVYTASGLNAKRACAILTKWLRKGWYDYGTTIDLGWMTAKGMAAQVPIDLTNERLDAVAEHLRATGQAKE